MNIRFDKSLGRTVLFSVAVVSFVIAVYQTILRNSIRDNYEIYMVSFVCVMWLRYLGLNDKAEKKAAAVASESTATKPAGKRPTARAKAKRR